MSKRVVPSIARPKSPPSPAGLSEAATHAAYNWGKRYKNPIALSRNFVDASWWQPACHKPDLPSGFVKFMRIGETVYGGWKEETVLCTGGEG